MNLSQVLNDALNNQIVHEYHNMLVYKQVESYFQNLQLKHIALYFAKQAQEEKGHGDKIIDYLNSRTGGIVTITSVPAPMSLLSYDPASIGTLYVSTEEETTRHLEEIYGLALESDSFMDLNFLREMLAEQVEEEDSANQFAMNLSMAKDIVLFDKSMED